MFYKDIVKFWKTSKQQPGVGRFAVSILMLLLWLGTFALAASPQLHRLVHPDAQNLDHHCLITQVQQHLLLAAFAAVVVPVAVSPEPASTCREAFQFLPACDYGVSPSRAPPSFISSLVVVG